MRTIHLAPLDKVRPAVLRTRTRTRAIGPLPTVAVAAISSTIRQLATEILVDES